jgi:hypothetical protein
MYKIEQSPLVLSQPILEEVLVELKNFRSPTIYGVPLLTNARVLNGFISQKLQYSNRNNVFLVNEFDLLGQSKELIVKSTFKSHHIGTRQFLKSYCWTYNYQAKITHHSFNDKITGLRCSSRMLEIDPTYNTITSLEADQILSDKLIEILQILRNSK